MDNPIKVARAATKLSRTQMAIKMGISASRLVWVENGHPAVLPPSLRAPFASVGWDFDAMAQQYTDWRQAEGAALPAVTSA